MKKEVLAILLLDKEIILECGRVKIYKDIAVDDCMDTIDIYVVEWAEYDNPLDSYNESEYDELVFNKPELAAECFEDLCLNYNTGGMYLLGDNREYFKDRYKERNEHEISNYNSNI